MEYREYMKVHYNHFPQDIREQYNLKDKVSSDGYIYVKITKGMYGLKASALLAYSQLVKALKYFGYNPIPGTMGFWRHTTRPISVCLCVDDFCVKYQNKEDVTHLLTVLGSKYKHSINWSGANYCGLRIKWNYDKEIC